MANLLYILSTCLGIYLVFSYSRSLWQQVRALDRTAKSWSGVLGAAVGLAFGAFVVLLMGTTAWNSVVGSARLSALEGSPAPELLYSSVPEEQTGSLADYRGQVVLVNFWATWCAPCIREMPALDKLQEAYSDRGLVVLHISDEAPGVLAEYLQESPMSTVHGQVPGFMWPAFARPTSFVVDREGIVRDTLVGGRSFKSFESAIAKWL